MQLEMHILCSCHHEVKGGAGPPHVMIVAPDHLPRKVMHDTV